MTIAGYEVETGYITGRENVSDALSRIRKADHPVEDCVISALIRGRRNKSEDGSSTLSPDAGEVI